MSQKCMACLKEPQEGNPLITNGDVIIHKNCNGSEAAFRILRKINLMAQMIKDCIYFDWNRALETKNMSCNNGELASKMIGKTSNTVVDFLKQCNEFQKVETQLEIINETIQELPINKKYSKNDIPF